jgi:hypothetical protein
MFLVSFLGGIIFWHGNASAAVNYGAAFNQMPFRLPDDQYGLISNLTGQPVANPAACGFVGGCYGTNYAFMGDGSGPTFVTLSNKSINDDNIQTWADPGKTQPLGYGLAHSVELKIYATSPTNQSLSFFLVNRNVGADVACHNMLTAIYYRGTSNFGPTVSRVRTNGCQQSYSFNNFPAADFSPLLDANGAPTGLYFGRIMIVFGDENGNFRPPAGIPGVNAGTSRQSSIKISTSGRLGYMGDNDPQLPGITFQDNVPSQALHAWANVYPTNFSSSNNLRFYFRPSCTAAPNSQFLLQWADVNNGQKFQNPGDTASVYRFIPGDPASLTKLKADGTPDPNPATSTYNSLGGGNNSYQLRLFNTQNYGPGQPYAFMFEFQGITGGNGISFNSPFDSADARIPCIPKSNITANLQCKTLTVNNPSGAVFSMRFYNAATNAQTGATGNIPNGQRVYNFNTFVSFPPPTLYPWLTYYVQIFDAAGNFVSRSNTMGQCMTATCLSTINTTPDAKVEPGTNTAATFGIGITNNTNATTTLNGFNISVSADQKGIVMAPNPNSQAIPINGFTPGGPHNLIGPPWNITSYYTGIMSAQLRYNATDITTFFFPSCIGSYTPQTRPYISVENGDISAGGGYAVNAAGQCSAASKQYITPNTAAIAPADGKPDDVGGIRTFATPPAYNSSSQFAAYALGYISGDTTNTKKYGFFSDHANLSPTGLMFANDGGFGGNLGGLLNDRAINNNLLVQAHCAPDYYTVTRDPDPTKIQPLGNNINLDSVQSGQYQVNGKATIRGKVHTGRSVTIYVDDSVLIDGDIGYDNWQFDTTDPANPTNNAPYLAVITKGDIHVDPGVSEINGMFVAQTGGPAGTDGIFSSCSLNSAGAFVPATQGQLATAGAARACLSNILKINGSVIAQHAYLERAVFSLNQATLAGLQASEDFNFAPSAIVGTPAFNANDNPIDAVFSLPPVF